MDDGASINRRESPTQEFNCHPTQPNPPTPPTNHTPKATAPFWSARHSTSRETRRARAQLRVLRRRLEYIHPSGRASQSMHVTPAPPQAAAPGTAGNLEGSRHRARSSSAAEQPRNLRRRSSSSALGSSSLDDDGDAMPPGGRWAFHSPFLRKPMSVVVGEEEEEKLERRLSLYDLLAIGIGGTVGSGIFVLAGEIANAPDLPAGPGASERGRRKEAHSFPSIQTTYPPTQTSGDLVLLGGGAGMHPERLFLCRAVRMQGISLFFFYCPWDFTPLSFPHHSHL